MTIKSLANKVVDAGTDIAGIGIASLVFLLILGRAVNSPTANKLETVPFLGMLVKPLRAATNQAYDVSTED